MNNIKKISSAVGVGIILSATILGSSYGFYKAVDNKGPIDNSYNQRVLIESKLNLGEGTTIEDASKYVDDTLTFIGQNNANVWVSGDQTLMIDAPVSTYKDAIDKDDKEDNIFNQMTYEQNNLTFVTDVAKLYVSTLFNANLDFRNEAGEQIFVSSGNGYKFDSSALVAETTEEGSSPASVYSYTSTSDYDFYGSADLSYSNGAPVINVSIDKDNLNMFKEFNNYLSQNQGQETLAPYYIWFGYDELESFVNEVYPSYDGTGLSQFIDQEWIKPFYITSSSLEIMNSRFEDKISIKSDSSTAGGTFTEKQAKYYVNNINNSDSFTSDISSLSVNLYTEDLSGVMLIVMASLFIVIIIVVMFLMSWYFGLLGMIASIGYLLINMLTALIYSSIGLTVTMIGLIGFIVVALVVAYMFYGMVGLYKNNNQDRYMSVTRRFTDKFKLYNKQNFAPLVVLLIVIFVCGMMLPAIIAATLYLMVIAFSISYLTILLTMVVFYGLDLLIRFTFQDYDVKWAFEVGQMDRLINKKINYNDSISKVRTTVISLSSVVVLLLTIVGMGFIFSTTGSITNSNMYGTQNYVYNVKLIDANAINAYGFGDLSITENNLEYAEDFYNETASLTNEVEKAFENANVNVSNIKVVRNDDITYTLTSDDGGETFTNELIDVASFGYNVTSKDAINQETFDNVNANLATIATSTSLNNNHEGVEYPFNISEGVTGFELTKTLSLSESGSTIVANKIVNTTNDRVAIKGIYMLLIFIIAFSFIILFVARWGAALAVMITSTIEAIFIYTPIFLLFVPFTQLLLFPILLLMALSAAVKTYIIKKVKDDERQTEDIWIKHTENQQFLVPLLSTVIAIASLFMIPALGVVSAVIFGLFTLWIGFVILLTQRYVFTYFARILTNFNNRVKNNRVSDDIRRAQNSNEPQEEYIEGVNM